MMESCVPFGAPGAVTRCPRRQVREAIDRLKERRTALHSAAMTGKIDSGRRLPETVVTGASRSMARHGVFICVMCQLR
jgi:hypothetical protein